jgi:excisionase family DNA binding protein
MTLDDLRACTAAALTVTQVAGLLDVDERTIRRACQDGQLTCLSVGRRLLIPTEPLRALLTTPLHNGAEPRQGSATATHEPAEGAQSHGVTSKLRSA